MSRITVRLPDSFHKQLREFARKEGISINQLAASALSEKMAALATLDYFKARAERESRDKFEAALAQVPSVPPDPQDTLTQ